MKYKNITKVDLEFYMYDLKGVNKKVKVAPDEEVETSKELDFKGMKSIEPIKPKKIEKEDD